MRPLLTMNRFKRYGTVWLLLFFSLNAMVGQAQSVLTLQDGKQLDSINLFQHVSVYLDTLVDEGQIGSPPLEQTWVPLTKRENWDNPRQKSHMAIWTKFTIHNTSKVPIEYRLLHKEYISYCLSSIKVFRLGIGQKLEPIFESFHTLNVPISVDAADSITIFAVEFVTGAVIKGISPQNYMLLSDEANESVWRQYHSERRNRFYFYTFFSGALVIIVLIGFFQFIFLRKKAYLFYAFFLLSVLLARWSYLGVEHYEKPMWGMGFIPYLPNTELISFGLVAVFYILSNYYTLKTLIPIDKGTKILIYLSGLLVLFGVGTAAAGIYVISKPSHEHAYESLRVTTYLIGAAGVITGTIYLSFNNFSIRLMGIGLIGMVCSLVWAEQHGKTADPMVVAKGLTRDYYFISAMGILWDAAFFFAALIAVQFHKHQKGRDQQKAAKDKLERENPQEHLTLLKNLLVVVQTSPHFVGNTIAEVKSLLGLGRTAEASAMLQVFAEMSHSFNKNIDAARIGLEEEWKNMEMFIEIMGMRYPGRFSVIFEENNPVSLEVAQIPPSTLRIYADMLIYAILAKNVAESIPLTISVQEEGSQLTIVMEAPVEVSGLPNYMENLVRATEFRLLYCKQTVSPLLDDKVNMSRITIQLPIDTD
jgi:hypothetical protein